MNDSPATAIELPIGSGSGSGTTVGATPSPSWQNYRALYYYWSDPGPCDVRVTVTPGAAAGVRMIAALNGESPANTTWFDDWEASNSSASPNSFELTTFFWGGGPLTLVISMSSATTSGPFSFTWDVQPRSINPPPNCTPETAIALTDTSGSLTGTLIDVPPPTGAYESWNWAIVWYYWPDLPAGRLHLVCEVDAPSVGPPYSRVVVSVAPNMPTAVTEDDYWWSGDDVDNYTSDPGAIDFTVPHLGGPFTIMVLTPETHARYDFTIEWGLSPLQRPPNDTPETATLLPLADYWGVARGTTVDAVIPYFPDPDWPYTAAYHNVWWYWESMPAGMVYFYVKPDVDDSYLDAYLFLGRPGEAPDSYADEYHYPGSWCMISAFHPGGPLTLLIETSPSDQCDFTFGWGHELDDNPDHWFEPEEYWFPASPGLLGFSLEASWGIRNIETRPAPITVPSSAALDCVFRNAQTGARGWFLNETGACSPQAPGIGDGMDFYTSSSSPAECRYTTQPFFLGGSPQRNQRDDMYGLRNRYFNPLLPASLKPIDPEDPPKDFYNRVDDPDDELYQGDGFNWGWVYVGDEDDWVRGDFIIGVETWASAFDFEVTDEIYPATATVEVRTVPASAIKSESEYTGEPNQMKVDSTGRIVAATWLHPTLLSAPIATWDITIAVPGPHESRVITFPPGDPAVDATVLPVFCVTMSEMFGAAAPFAPTVTGNINTAVHVISKVNSNIVSAVLKVRSPHYLVYKGFPLEARTGGWHIGRMATGSW